jgi:hypothetical protein
LHSILTRPTLPEIGTFLFGETQPLSMLAHLASFFRPVFIGFRVEMLSAF